MHAFRPPRIQPGRLSRTDAFTGIERKFFDSQTVGDAFTTTWAAMETATTNLTAMGQGDEESERDGRKIVIDSIHLRGFVRLAGTELNSDIPESVLCRVVLVLDQQTNGATIAPLTVMDVGQTDDLLAFRRLDNTQRYNILWDQMFEMTSPSISHFAVDSFSNAEVRKHFTKTVVFNPPMEVNMSGTTTDIANVKDNNIHVIGISSGQTNATVTLDYQCRVRFRD